MALLWADGFDHWYTLANADSVYHNLDNGPTIINNAAISRTGTGCLLCQGQGHNRGFYLDIAPGDNVIISSLSFFVTALPTTDSLGFVIAGLAYANAHVSLFYNTAGGISAYTKNRSVLLGKSADGILGVGSWVSVQSRVVIDPVAGSIEVRLNGASDPILLLQNINTSNEADATIGSFAFGYINDFNNPTNYIDDLVIFDGTGATDNDFVGDLRCRTRYANANGPDQDWTSLSGAAAYSELSHVPSVPATYGIVGAAVGNESNFALDLVPDNTSFCAGMFMFVQALKSDAGASHLNMNIQSGASSSPLVGVNPGTAAAYYTGACEVDPATGTYWTKDALQSALVNFARDV